MSAFTDFLSIVGDRPIFACSWFESNGNRVGMNGKIVAYDDKHVVIQGQTSMHLLRVEDIIEIEVEASTEIVAP